MGGNRSVEPADSVRAWDGQPFCVTKCVFRHFNTQALPVTCYAGIASTFDLTYSTVYIARLCMLSNTCTEVVNA